MQQPLWQSQRVRDCQDVEVLWILLWLKTDRMLLGVISTDQLSVHEFISLIYVYCDLIRINKIFWKQFDSKCLVFDAICDSGILQIINRL